jgi:hypothetical protein
LAASTSAGEGGHRAPPEMITSCAKDGDGASGFRANGVCTAKLACVE